MKITQFEAPADAALPLLDRMGHRNLLYRYSELRASRYIPGQLQLQEPGGIVDRLHFETAKALALPDLRARLANLRMEGIGNSPDEFAAAIKSEIPKWAKVINDSGIERD